jgi:hypothetical protein
MSTEHETKSFIRFLRGCMEELINCYGSSEWIKEEMELARFIYTSLEKDVFLEGQAWAEGAAQAKENKRGQEARKKLAGVLVHALSRKSASEKNLDEQERQQRLEKLKKGWIEVNTLEGLNLTQIEACQLTLKARCNCGKTCRKINFTRDWSDVEKQCQARRSELTH